jgi:hypothetical protein
VITCNADNLVEELASLVDFEMIEHLRGLTKGISPSTAKIDAVISEVYPQLLLNRENLSDREKLDLMGLHRLSTASNICDGLAGYLGMFYCPQENLVEVQRILLSPHYISFREKLGVSLCLVVSFKPGYDWQYWSFDSFAQIYDEVLHYPDPTNFPPLLNVEVI